MIEQPGLTALLRTAMMPFLCLCLLGYFGVHAFFGDTGLSSWPELRQERAALTRQGEAVKARKAELEHKVALLDPRGVDPDYADELVRANLGVVRPDEVVIALKNDR